MAIENNSFEEPGSRPGLAAGWRLSAYAALWRFAAFDDPPLGLERFRWGKPLAALFAETLSPAIFDARGEAVEDFFEGWTGNDGDVYLFLLDDGVAEVAVFGGEAGLLLDTFGPGWGGEGYVYAWADLEDADLVEESDLAGVEWPGYVFAWSGVDADAASFSGEPVETFEDWE